MFFRLSLGFVVVLAYLAARRRLDVARLRSHRGLLIGSGCVLAVHWGLLFEAYQRLSVATTILIVFLGPVLMAVASPFVLGERLRAIAVVAFVLAVGGIALMEAPSVGHLDTLGLASAIGSATLFAVLILMGKRLTAHYEPAAITLWQLGVASIVMAPALAGAHGTAIARALPGLLALGMVHSGLLGIVFFHAVRALEAQQLGVLFYLEPASAVLYAWLLLGERPSAATLGGGVMIVVAGLAIIFGDRTDGAVVPAATPEVPG